MLFKADSFTITPHGRQRHAELYRIGIHAKDEGWPLKKGELSKEFKMKLT